MLAKGRGRSAKGREGRVEVYLVHKRVGKSFVQAFGVARQGFFQGKYLPSLGLNYVANR